MSLKNIIPVFLCAVLNLSGTTQETQTDPLPEIYQLPAVQPICFSETTISKALQAAQIREQDLRSEILAEEEKGQDVLTCYAYKSRSYQRMVTLTKAEQKLGIDGHIAIVCFREEWLLNEIMRSAQAIFLQTILNNYFVSGEIEPYSNPPGGLKFYDTFYNIGRFYGKEDIDSQNFPEGTIKTLYFQELCHAKPFLGRLVGVNDQLKLRVKVSRYCELDQHYFLEPVEGEYHVDEEGRMMPIFTLVVDETEAPVE